MGFGIAGREHVDDVHPALHRGRLEPGERGPRGHLPVQPRRQRRVEAALEHHPEGHQVQGNRLDRASLRQPRVLDGVGVGRDLVRPEPLLVLELTGEDLPEAPPACRRGADVGMYRSVLDRKQQTAARAFRDVFGDPLTVARERLGRSGRRERDRQRLDAVDPAHVLQLGLAGRLERFDPLGQEAESLGDLGPGEVATDAEVDAGAERQRCGPCPARRVMSKSSGPANASGSRFAVKAQTDDDRARREVDAVVGQVLGQQPGGERRDRLEPDGLVDRPDRQRLGVRSQRRPLIRAAPPAAAARGRAGSGSCRRRRRGC